MIEAISFGNYKAFTEGKIELKPLTLLLGANSSGKSSILQLFSLLEQTINNPESYQSEFYQSALKLKGSYINLGEDKNLIKDRKSNNPLIIEFKLNKQDYLQKLDETHKEINSYKEHQEKERKKEKQPLVHKEIKIFPSIKDKIDIVDYLNSLNPNKKLKVSSHWLELFSEEIKSHLNIELDKEILNEVDDFFNKIKSFCRNTSDVWLGYEFTLNSITKKLEIVKQYIKSDKKNIASLVTANPYFLIYSDILDSRQINEHLIKHSSDILYYDYLKLKPKIELKTNAKFSVYYIYQLFFHAYTLVSSYFDNSKINYVGPLRANPQRYYLSDEANIYTPLNTQSGTSFTKILKNNQEIRIKVNKWLKKFGINVSIKSFGDVIDNIQIHQHNLTLDITDVGFGISQILPILAQGFISSNKSLTIIEQPEIHLHPKMQADLADLFIDILKESTDQKGEIKTKLLIETHSEYILKRLRRRVAEGKIDSKDIAIYFIEPRNRNEKDTAIIKEAKMSETGGFEWPEDFYITSYEDDMIYFKNIAKKQ